MLITRAGAVYGRLVLSLVFLLCTALFSTGCGGLSQENSPAGFEAIQHVIFIIKENHTFDNYFGTFPDADGATSGAISTGQVIPLAHMPDTFPYLLCNSWSCALTALDGGRMDKFDLIQPRTVNGEPTGYTQVTEKDIPSYFAYARNFVLADHMFSSVHGPSFPNHLYSVAAQSGGAIDNPVNTGGPLGCDAANSATVQVIDAGGNIKTQFPCFDFQTLPDSLQNAGITWKYYASDQGELCPLDAIKHIRNTSLWTEHIVPNTQFSTDAQNGQLPGVSWLASDPSESEHPPSSICHGENWTVEQLNAVMQGPDWNSTAVFITWDDFGGFYDHVPPPQTDQFGLGSRLPLLIISPFAKRGLVTHTAYEFSSFLKFVDTRYRLQPLTVRNNMANDMLDSFDFNQEPQPPLTLHLRLCP